MYRKKNKMECKIALYNFWDPVCRTSSASIVLRYGGIPRREFPHISRATCKSPFPLLSFSLSLYNLHRYDHRVRASYRGKVHHIIDSSIESTVRCQRTSVSCCRRFVVLCKHMCEYMCLYQYELNASVLSGSPVLVGPCFMTHIKQGR